MQTVRQQILDRLGITPEYQARYREEQERKHTAWMQQTAPTFRSTPQPQQGYLLTPKQVQGIDALQNIIKSIERHTKELNTIIISHELPLHPVGLHELTDTLMQIDNLIRTARITAQRQGVPTIVPQVKLDYLNQLLGQRK